MSNFILKDAITKEMWNLHFTYTVDGGYMIEGYKMIGHKLQRIRTLGKLEIQNGTLVVVEDETHT